MSDLRKTTLRNEVDFLVGFPFKSEGYTSEGVRLLRGDNIAQGTLSWSDAKKWPTSQREDFEPYELQEGDIVLAMDRPWIDAGLKYASVSRYDLPCLLVQRTARLRGGKNLDTKFLKYVIGSPQFTKYIKYITTGSLVPHISGDQIKDFSVHLPHLSTQKKIAAVLSALDAKIDCNNRVNADLEAMAKALYDYWFVQFDFPDANGKPYKSSGGKMVYNATLRRDIPVGWNSGNLAALISLEYGKPLKADIRTGSGFPVIGSNGIVGYHSEYLVQGPGIVIGRKGTVGAITYIHDNFFPIDTTYYVKQVIDIGFFYLKFLLCSLGLEKMNSDSAVPGLNREAALRISIVIPPIGVIEIFESKMAAIFSKQHSILKENQQLAQLRDWLLPLLMNGQVTVA